MLPSGLTLTSRGLAAGTIAGTPTLAGTFTGIVDAGNGASPDATEAFTIVVDQSPAFTGNTTLRTPATVGVFYLFQYTAAGTPAPTFTLISGALPSGLSLSSTGVLSGTLALSGTFTGVIDAGNGIGPDATQSLTIVVGQAAAIVSSDAVTFTAGSAAAFTVAESGAPAPTFSESGALPSGVTFDAATGVLGGTPAAMRVASTR